MDEKHIPTSRRGVKRAELSQSKARREPGSFEVLFKFQCDFMYTVWSSSLSDGKRKPLPRAFASKLWQDSTYDKVKIKLKLLIFQGDSPEYVLGMIVWTYLYLMSWILNNSPIFSLNIIQTIYLGKNVIFFEILSFKLLRIYLECSQI